MSIRNDFQHSRATEERTNTKKRNVAIMKQYQCSLLNPLTGFCFKICIILNHGDPHEMFVYHLSFEKSLAQRLTLPFSRTSTVLLVTGR